MDSKQALLNLNAHHADLMARRVFCPKTAAYYEQHNVVARLRTAMDRLAARITRLDIVQGRK